MGVVSADLWENSNRGSYYSSHHLFNPPLPHCQKRHDVQLIRKESMVQNSSWINVSVYCLVSESCKERESHCDWLCSHLVSPLAVVSHSSSPTSPMSQSFLNHQVLIWVMNRCSVMITFKQEPLRGLSLTHVWFLLANERMFFQGWHLCQWMWLQHQATGLNVSSKTCVHCYHHPEARIEKSTKSWSQDTQDTDTGVRQWNV